MDETDPNAQGPEPTPEPKSEPAPVQATPPKEKKPPKTESRSRRIILRTVRWVLGLLIVLGLGALVVLFTLYIPARQKVNESNARLEQANQKVAELQNQIANLSGLENNNKSLQSEIDKANLHIAILSIRTDVAMAQLALAKNDPTKARVALTQTPATLTKLAGLIDSNQRKVVTDMQDRLKLATAELDSNAYAAQSDLDVLATSLVELENAYFTSP
jgi:type II secretory pathway component PulM